MATGQYDNYPDDGELNSTSAAKHSEVFGEFLTKTGSKNGIELATFSKDGQGFDNPAWTRRLSASEQCPKSNSLVIATNTKDNRKSFVKHYFSPRSIQRLCCTRDVWLQRFPIFKWLPRYSRRNAAGDLIAGITVGLTVVPQSLAYAAIAGLPLQYGLYSSFVGCFVYCVLGTSKDVAMGPAALISLLTASVITKLQPFNPEYAVCVCFLVGLIQLALGILRLGILIDFVSTPVLKGFVCSGALIIAAEQIKNLLGIKSRRGAFYVTVYDGFANIAKANIYDVIVSAISFAVLIAMKYLTWPLVCRIFRIRTSLSRIKEPNATCPDSSTSNDAAVIISPTPSSTSSARKIRSLKLLRFTIRIISLSRNALVVILASIAAYIMLSNNIDAITLSEHVPPGLPPVRPPPFTFIHVNGNDSSNITQTNVFDLIETSGSGIGILALLSLLMTVSVGKALGARNGYYIDPTQEFVAVGLCNILSSFVSSYPVATAFSRASLNSDSGVQTPAGGLVTGGLVILALSFSSPYFSYIPRAALGAVIVCAVVPLFEWNVFRDTWRVNKLDIVPLLATMIGAFMLGSEYGIIIGVVLSLILVLYNNARPKVEISRFNIPEPRWKSSTSATLLASPSALSPSATDIFVFTPYGSLNFSCADFIRDLLNQQWLSTDKNQHEQPSSDVTVTRKKMIIIDASHVAHCDYTAAGALRDALVALTKRQVQVVFVGLKPEVELRLKAIVKTKTYSSYKTLDEAHNATCVYAGSAYYASVPRCT